MHGPLNVKNHIGNDCNLPHAGVYICLHCRYEILFSNQ